MLSLSGKEPAAAVRAWIKGQIEGGKYGAPHLVSITVGDDPASGKYRSSQIKACEAVGVRTTTEFLHQAQGEEALAALIKKVSSDADTDGIILQTPLPPQWRLALMREFLDPDKDVEGVHPQNLGRLMLGRSDIPLPCTPWAVMSLLDWYDRSDLTGQSCVVIGTSTTVGRPLSILLSQRNATVLQLRSSTDKTHFANLVSFGDIVISAAGVPELVKGFMVRSGAWIIDVGMNLKDGKMVGDVDSASLDEHVAALTPVPGGVGPMTVTLLLANLLSLFCKKNCGHYMWAPIKELKANARPSNN